MSLLTDFGLSPPKKEKKNLFKNKTKTVNEINN